MRTPGEADLHGHYLEWLCLKGWDHRGIPDRAEKVARRTGLSYEQQYQVYIDRLKHELAALRRQGFVDYTLLVRDLMNWCRRSDIMVGPGRGSSAGSLVYYLLGITSVDPIEHRLLFERFLSPDRVDQPDCDMDFEDARREEVVAYLREKYGAENVSQIATVSQMKGKLALKDVARVFEIPFEEVNKVTSSIITRAAGDERAFHTVEDSFKESTVGAEFARRHPESYRFTVLLEGLHKNMGMHAAGVVVSPMPVTDVAPLEAKTEDGKQTRFTAVDKDGVEQLGLLKLDVLGLKTLTQLKAALRAIKERRGVSLDLEALEFDDRRVLKRFSEQEFVGVFQFDSSSVEKLAEGVRFDSFDDLVAMNALNRPGTTRTGVADSWAKRRMGRDKVKPIHPIVDEILKDTEGIILYQEQSSRILIEVGGYTPGEADKIRKLGSKSKGVELVGKEEPKFVAGAVARGFDEAVARSLFNTLKGLGAYSFNRCVTGDTVLCRAGGNKWLGKGDTSWTVEEYYRRLHGEKTHWVEKFKAGRCRVLMLCDEDARIRPGRIVDVIESGEQLVYELTTASGAKIKATRNHRFLTARGYVKVDDLVVCQDQMVMSQPSYVNEQRQHKRHQNDRAIGKSYEGCGMPEGEENPAWVDGRTGLFEGAKVLVAVRARNCCERCHKEQMPGERYEFAHLQSLESLGGVVEKYHSPENMQRLCNSCHKLVDYRKGERRAAWSKGRASYLSTIVSVRPVGFEQTYDVVMGEPEHNFIANGFVSHNSHAAAYAAISYWQMYLKTYYPTEFMWALLRNEDDRDVLTRYVKEAERLGIHVRSPDVNDSALDWVILDDSTIVAPVANITGVGESAAKDLAKKRPFASLADLFARVDRRLVNRRVLVSLALADAMGSLLPNKRAFVENAEKVCGAREPAKAYEDHLGEPDYDPEEAIVQRSRVCPMAMGQHPLEAYAETVAAMGQYVAPESFSDVRWDGRLGFFLGMIVNAKVARLNDRSDKSYAHLAVEDQHGHQLRVKVEPRLFDRHRYIIADRGVGTCVALAGIKWKDEQVKLSYMVDLEDLRQGLRKGEPWQGQAAWFAEAPVVKHGAPKADMSEVLAKKMPRPGGVVQLVALVLALKEHKDKRKQDMAFFDLGGWSGSVPAICFGSSYGAYQGVLEPGTVVKIELVRGDNKSWILDAEKGCRVVVLEKPPANSGL